MVVSNELNAMLGKFKQFPILTSWVLNAEHECQRNLC